MLLSEIFSILTHLRGYPQGISREDLNKQPSPHTQPLVLVHGYMSNKSIWNEFKSRFELLGWKNIHCYNYHVFENSIDKIVDKFDYFMDDVLEAYEYSIQLSFIGHSMGGILIRDWVTRQDHSTYVDKVITIGSPHQGTKMAIMAYIIPLTRPYKVGRDLAPNSKYLSELNSREQPKRVNWCSIYSNADQMIVPKTAALYPSGWNFTSHKIEEVGHTHLVYCVATTLLCYKFLSIEKGLTVENTC